eukprot:1352416-Pyramimonas_sp.AAC.1
MPERAAAPVLRHLRDEMPRAPGRGNPNQALAPRRILLEGAWDGGPSFVRLADLEDGFHSGWNLADMGESRPED